MQLKLVIEMGNETGEIVKQFNNYYPFLKIEFYTKPFFKQRFASKKDATETNAKFESLTHFNCNGSINISGNRTVRELENDIATLGLYGQVLRKSGNLWIETVLTNDWTLKHQNDEGEQISSLFEQGIIRTE